MFYLASRCHSPELPETNLPSVSGVSKTNNNHQNNSGLADADDIKPGPSTQKNTFDIQYVKWTKKTIDNTITFMEEYDFWPGKEEYEEEYVTYTKLFEVLKLGKDKFLIKKREKKSDPIVRVLEVREYFDILNKAYIKSEHVNDIAEIKSIVEEQHWIPFTVIKMFCKLHESSHKLKYISTDAEKRESVAVVGKDLFQMALNKMYQTLFASDKSFTLAPKDIKKIKNKVQSITAKSNKSKNEPIESVSKEQFEVKLNKILYNIKLTNHNINTAIKLIDEYDVLPNKWMYDKEYQECIKNKYEVLKSGNDKYLIKRREKYSDTIERVVHEKEYYGILNDVHMETKHGDSTEMKLIIEKQYFIPEPIIELFYMLCNTCQKKKSDPMNFTEVFADRGRIELIDMREKPDGEYIWVLHYQDLKTKFSIIRPLVSKNIDEISLELLKIFSQYGFPLILEPKQSQGREFLSELIKKLEGHFPDCKILNGKPTLDTPKTKITPIDEMLTKWMSQNKSKNWSKGIPFVQHLRNTFKVSKLEVSPFRSLFGDNNRLSVTMSMIDNLPVEIKTEEEYMQLADD